jgi:hypothetical protein
LNILHLKYKHWRVWTQDLENSRDQNTWDLQCCFQLYRRERWPFAAESAVAIAESLIAGTEYDLESDLQKMREIRERVRLGPSTGSIVEEAVSRNILGSD